MRHVAFTLAFERVELIMLRDTRHYACLPALTPYDARLRFFISYAMFTLRLFTRAGAR